MSKPSLLVVVTLAFLWSGKALPLVPPRHLTLAQVAHAVLLVGWLTVLSAVGGFGLVDGAGPWRARALAVGAAAGVALFLVGGVGYAVSAGPLGLEPPGEAALAAGMRGWPLLPLSTAVVAAAAVEEWLFRGVLLEGLSGMAGMAPWGAVLLSSILFAAYHVALFQALPTLLLGLGLGSLVLWTGSLWPAVVAHVTYNLLGIAAFVAS